MVSPAVRPSCSYDDPAFNYQHYWRGREYEHRAEEIALRRLLSGRRFAHAVDVGGGYGRLSIVLSDYAGKVTLVDSSRQQLELSEKFLPASLGVDRQLAEAASLPLPDECADLLTMIRVVHHLADPGPEIAEAVRVLRPGGLAVIEAANSAHAVNRLRASLRGHRIPAGPVDISSGNRGNGGAPPFMNYHPSTISRQFGEAGLCVRAALSVSNLRHPLAKKILPGRFILAVEKAGQRPLARLHFGPSMFFLLQK
jgi:SAM-dependent methyltransferase